MAQTVANFADVMKEVWTSDRLEKQFYDENPLLDRLTRTNKFTIGKQAQVPVHKGRSGGYSVKSSAGGTLNAADEQKVDTAIYTLSYHWFQISIETGALNQAGGGKQSVANAKNLEIEGAVADLSRQATRQAVGNGDALIAQCAAGAANTTVLLSTTGYGYDAIARGWLYSGLLVDIGTAANEVAVADGVEIISVNESSTAPSFVASASVTETANDFVSIKDARSGTTSNEMNGLRTIAGSTTSAIGGLAPGNAGEEFWAPAHVDTTTTTVSLDLLLTLRRRVHQKTGKAATMIVTSLDQAANIESLLQNQVRYTNPNDLKVNNATLNVNGQELMALPDVPARELYCITPEDMLVVTGTYNKPTWVSDIEGAGGSLRWSQGATNFVDAVTYPFNIAIRRRNSHAAAISLTA